MFENFNDVFTVDDLCNALQIGKNSAYKLLQDNEIPSKRIAGKYRIPKHYVIEYINKQMYETIVEFQMPEEVNL